MISLNRIGTVGQRSPRPGVTIDRLLAGEDETHLSSEASCIDLVDAKT
ncbi:MAG: hypothetical protein IBX46_09980 [Desulfuromonadales bacterium]|nr:hypothetical protein [Desulfuromonadales bacterium]